VQSAIQNDFELTPENRQLALDMVNHFNQFGSTMCRNCAIGWGTYFFLEAIIIFAFSLGVVIIAAGIISMLISMALFSCASYIGSRTHKSATALQQREQAALAETGIVILPVPLPT
jgi:hypothetical protein